MPGPESSPHQARKQSVSSRALPSEGCPPIGMQYVCVCGYEHGNHKDREKRRKPNL